MPIENIKSYELFNVFRISASGIFLLGLLNGISLFFKINLHLSYNLNSFNFDAPLPWQMNFQQSASPTMEGIVDLHHNIMTFMIYVVIFISYIMVRAVMRFNSNKKDALSNISRTRHFLSLEIIWTIIPLFILFWIALPSFALLYSIDHCPKIDLTVKVIGRQWYWTYEIDTFLKYRMKKPNYSDFRETGLIYELISKVSSGIFKDKDILNSIKNNTSFLTPNPTSTNNLFFASLHRLINSNFNLTENDMNKLLNVYIKCVTQSKRLGNVKEDSFILENTDKDHWIFSQKVLDTEYDVDYMKIWNSFTGFSELPGLKKDISNGVGVTSGEQIISELSGDDNDVISVMCPKNPDSRNGYTMAPYFKDYWNSSWLFNSLVENFDEIYDSKHRSGFSIMAKSSFNQLLANTYIEIYKNHDQNNIREHKLIELHNLIICSLLSDSFNESDLVSWFYMNNFFTMHNYLKDVKMMCWLSQHQVNEKNVIMILSEFFYFDRAHHITKNITPFIYLAEMSNFKYSGLLKDFFYSLTTGEYSFFKTKLNITNITLNDFIRSFTDWYSKIYENFSTLMDDHLSNPIVFYPLLSELSGDFSWIKNAQSNLFLECPTPFVKNIKNYTGWVSYMDFRFSIRDSIDPELLFKPSRLDPLRNYSSMCNTVDSILGISQNDLTLLVDNRNQASSLINKISLRTFLFFHNSLGKGMLQEYSRIKNKFSHFLVEFDSCIVSDNEVYNNYLKICKNESSLNLKNLPTSFCGWLRLLEVDNRLVLPIKTRLRILVTSSDVLHSWAVPSLGIKIDACPGRLNCVYVYIKRPGVFHGQCSELCGVKHGFMPIVVHAVTRDKYNRWFADTCELVS